YEESVILAWTSIEAAARGGLSNVARAKGVTPAALWQLLVDNVPKVSPLSSEEAVERTSPSIFKIFEVFSELRSTGYDSGSLAQSVREAYGFRNMIAHEGERVGFSDTQRVLEAVAFTLSAWGLKTTEQMLSDWDTTNW